LAIPTEWFPAGTLDFYSRAFFRSGIGKRPIATPLPLADSNFISIAGGWRHGCLAIGKSEQYFAADPPSRFSIYARAVKTLPLKLSPAPSSLLVVEMLGMERRQLSK
jgi:hypothetical protein